VRAACALEARKCAHEVQLCAIMRDSARENGQAGASAKGLADPGAHRGILAKLLIFRPRQAEKRIRLQVLRARSTWRAPRMEGV